MNQPSGAAYAALVCSASARFTSIQPPECSVERCGKGHPGQVRSHKPRGAGFHAARTPAWSAPIAAQSITISTSAAPMACWRKKIHVQARFRRQLRQKQPKRPASRRRWRSQPNPPGRECHQRIKQRPHRPKDPVRRRNRGACKRRYQPVISLAVHRPPTPATAKQSANQKTNASQRTVVLPSFSSLTWSMLISHECTA